MIRRHWKILLIGSFSFLLGFAAACGPGLNVKLYRINNERGGIYRGQANELLRFPQVEGYYCTSPQDMQKLVEAYRSCQELCSR